MTVQDPTSPSVCFCTTWENQNNRNVIFIQGSMII